MKEDMNEGKWGCCELAEKRELREEKQELQRRKEEESRNEKEEK